MPGQDDDAHEVPSFDQLVSADYTSDFDDIEGTVAAIQQAISHVVENNDNLL